MLARRLFILGPLVALLVGMLPSTPARALTGDITQLSGTDGCVADTGDGIVCVDGRALNGGNDLVSSPDGSSVYSVSRTSDSIAIFDRDTTSLGTYGKLTQKAATAGCINTLGTDGCGSGKGLDGAYGVDISPDGKSVYVASDTDSAVAIFDRAADGSLTQKLGTLGCVSDDGSSGACVVGRALNALHDVAVSADGDTVYAVGSDGVAIFDRDQSATSARGTLTQKPGKRGCVTEDGSAGLCADGTKVEFGGRVLASRDGLSVYEDTGYGISIFDRIAAPGPKHGKIKQKPGKKGCITDDGSLGLCKNGRGLYTPNGLALSPKGDFLYTAAINGHTIGVFKRDTSATTLHGELKQLAGTAGCSDQEGDEGCADVRAIDAPGDVAVAPDGLTVYAASFSSAAIASFDRDPATGQISQRATPDGCVARVPATEGCTASGGGLAALSGVTVTPTGSSLYTASWEGVAAFSRESGFVSCKYASPTQVGSSGGDAMIASDADDIVFGLGGADSIDGLDGHDLVCGGSGGDNITGSDGDDMLDGQKGNDTCVGGMGTDVVKHCETIVP